MQQRFSEDDREILIRVAIGTIETALGDGGELRLPTLGDYAANLHEHGASFVTLRSAERLRGCIGTLEAREAVVIDVARHAHAAAFADPRFPRLQTIELDRLSLEISVLSPSTPIDFADESALVAGLRVGIEGLTIESGGRRATFLPAVWESLPEPVDFLAHLKAKAGIPAGAGVARAWRYHTESFGIECVGEVRTRSA